MRQDQGIDHLAAIDATPTFEHQLSRIVRQIHEGISNHVSPAAWTAHNDPPSGIAGFGMNI
jgi:hypothetical protein